MVNETGSAMVSGLRKIAEQAHNESSCCTRDLQHKSNEEHES